MTAKVYCNGTRAKCLRDIELTVNMSGAPIEFEFSKEWDGLTKTAVFTSDGSRSRILDKDGKTTVPHEILTTVGMDVEVAVFSQREDGTTWPSPSLVCKIGQVKRGAKPDEDPSYPLTPDIAQQLQNQIDKLEDKVEDLEQGGTDNGFRVQDTALVATRRKTIPDMDAEEHLGHSLRGIFADSNIVQGGDFESGIPAIGGVEGTMTDNAPSITDGMLALNAGGAGSYISLPAYTFEVGRTYYVAARFKVDEYTQGRMGVQSTQSIYAPKEPSLGAWVTVSSYLQRTTKYSGASYIGAMKESGTGGAQPILKGYIDNVCVLDLTAIFGEGAEPGKEKMDELYALYLAALEGRSINGSFTIASLPDAGELPAEECLYRFKRAMNAKAKYIGMSGSSFISPSGLALTGTDDPFLQNNYGTAADMMKLGLACFSSEKLMQILRVYSYNGITSLVRGGALESAIAEAQYHYYGGKGGSLIGSASGQEGHGILNFVALCAAGDYSFVVSVLGEWLYDEDGSKKSVSPLVVDALEAVYTKLTRGTAVVGEALRAAIDRAEYPVSVAACAIPAGSESAWAMYGGASVLDGAVSWSSTPEATHALASVTKLLTALVVLDNVHDLNERVTIKASDNVGGSGTALGEGESCTYNDLLHLMLMESNNCAATALGRAVGERLLRLGVTDAVQAATESVKAPAVPGGGITEESDPTVQGWAKTAISAAVGQYFKVSSVDENGNVTAVEAVDAPSGGGASEEVWELLADVTLEEETSTVTQTWAENPMRKVMINLSTLAYTENTSYMPTTIFTSDGGNPNFNIMRVYPTPLPKTSAENVTYIVEAFKLGEDAVLQFIEHTKGVFPISNQMSGVGAVNSFATYGNSLYSDALQDQITGITIHTYKTFAVGTRFTIWGVAK